MKRTILSLCLALMFCASPAMAAAPQPTNKIDISKMGGRWYEIARFYNHRQKDCFAAAAEWVRRGDGFSVINTCRQGAVTGPVKTVKASAKVVDPATNAKVKMTFMRLIPQEYWILDRAPDHSWFILATPGGNFVWLFSRDTQMPAAAKSAAVARIKQLGYDTGKLLFTPH